LRLVDSTKNETQWTRLDKMFRNDHERGETHKYSISAEGLDKPEQIAYIQIKRKCTIIDDHWFLDRVEVNYKLSKFLES
jgi:PLAT/LH2 domain